MVDGFVESATGLGKFGDPCFFLYLMAGIRVLCRNYMEHFGQLNRLKRFGDIGIHAGRKAHLPVALHGMCGHGNDLNVTLHQFSGKCRLEDRPAAQRVAACLLPGLG